MLTLSKCAKITATCVWYDSPVVWIVARHVFRPTTYFFTWKLSHLAIFFHISAPDIFCFISYFLQYSYKREKRVTSLTLMHTQVPILQALQLQKPSRPSDPAVVEPFMSCWSFLLDFDAACLGTQVLWIFDEISFGLDKEMKWASHHPCPPNKHSAESRDPLIHTRNPYVLTDTLSFKPYYCNYIF